MLKGTPHLIAKITSVMLNGGFRTNIPLINCVLCPLVPLIVFRVDNVSTDSGTHQAFFVYLPLSFLRTTLIQLDSVTPGQCSQTY